MAKLISDALYERMMDNIEATDVREQVFEEAVNFHSWMMNYLSCILKEDLRQCEKLRDNPRTDEKYRQHVCSFIKTNTEIQGILSKMINDEES